MNNVKYIQKEGFGEIILDRPKNNPLDLQTLGELISAFTESATKEDICVIFSATGKNFTVGADLKYLSKLIEHKNSEEFREFELAFQNLTLAMINHPGVVISGLHGWVVGGGFEISLSADIRIATYDTKVVLPELSIATMFSNASTKLLPQIIGLGKAKELMLLGTEINAEQGEQLGLFNKICPNEELDDILSEMAKKLVEKTDKTALRLAKELIHTNLQQSIEESLSHESKVLEQLSTRQAFISNIQKFVQNK